MDNLRRQQEEQARKSMSRPIVVPQTYIPPRTPPAGDTFRSGPIAPLNPAPSWSVSRPPRLATGGSGWDPSRFGFGGTSQPSATAIHPGLSWPPMSRTGLLWEPRTKSWD
jgi:hypothetical protein